MAEAPTVGMERRDTSVSGSETRPLRVCLVAPAPPPYGGVTHWAQLLRTYAAGRRDVSISLVDIAPHWRKVHDYSRIKRAVFGGLAIFGHLGRVLRHILRGCDVVHLASAGQLATFRDIPILLLCRLCRVPAFYHLHFGRIAVITAGDSREWRRLSIAIRLANATWVLDERSLTTIRRYLPKARVQCMPNGIEVASLPQPASGGSMRTVIYLGWVVPAKGMNELVLAWSELRPAGWRLQIVGPGGEQYRQELVQRYRPANLEFLGGKPHAQAMELLAAADVLVLPSHTEAFPFVIVEAMALGKPVVATAVGAIPEILADECGIAVPPQQVDRLKDALMQVMNDPQYRRLLGSNGRRRAAEHYTMDVVFRQMLAAWTESAGVTGRGAGAEQRMVSRTGGKVLKVCLVGPLPPPYGGIAHWVQMICEHARGRRDLKLEIVDISPRWRDIDDLAIWKRVVFGGLTMLWQTGMVVRRILGGCRVVHITAAGQLAIIRDILMIAVAKAFGVKTLYHIRFGRVPEIAEQRTGEWRRIALAMRMSHKVLAIDQATEAAIRKHLPGVDVVRVPNCVDLATLPVPKPVKQTPKTVMYLGWVIPAKGIEELVRAWADLRPAGWRLLVVGPGNTAYSQQLVQRYAPEGIEFLGELQHSEALETMAQSTIFVLPSHTEGFPNVIAEAMSLGRPIVATTVGAIPEMLSDGCGRLVSPCDATALREGLAAVMADLEGACAMGQRARQRVEDCYALSAIFTRLHALWGDAAGRGYRDAQDGDQTRENEQSCVNEVVDSPSAVSSR